MCVGKAHVHVNRKERALAKEIALAQEGALGRERACDEPETEKENNKITFHTIVLSTFTSAIMHLKMQVIFYRVRI